MPSEIVFLAEEAPEGGYTARALGASIFTEADTLEGLHQGVRDAVRCHYDEADRSTTSPSRITRPFESAAHQGLSRDEIVERLFGRR